MLWRRRYQRGPRAPVQRGQRRLLPWQGVLKVFQSCGDAIVSPRKRYIHGGEGAMRTQVLHGPYGHETDIVRHGTSPVGQQRARCLTCPERGRTFRIDSSAAGQSSAIKQQRVDMAMNASGIRATARVLHVSPTTVWQEGKKGTCNPASASGDVAAPAPRACRGGDVAR